MRRVPIIIVIAAAIGGVVWWLFQGPKPAPPVIPATSTPVTIAQPESAPQSMPAERKITPTSLVEPAAEPASRSATTAVMRGRCVDAVTGAGLPGCTTTLRGNGQEPWTGPTPVVTGADGRFEIRFDPPPSYAFFLSIEVERRATMMGRFSNLKPASVTDVGDVAMIPATAMKGRVVDEGGTPQPRVSLYLDLEGAKQVARGSVGLHSSLNVISKPDGVLAFWAPLSAGSWKVRVRAPFELVGPATVTIAEGEAERFLEVKVRMPSDSEAIIGVVRDDAGNPVPNADIDIEPRNDNAAHISEMISSDRDGAFRIQRANPKYEGTPSVTAKRTGYEASEPVRCPWGTNDVVLVVRRGLSVEVVVTDGDENKPLDRYGVRCFPLVRMERRMPRAKGMSFSHGGTDPMAAQLRERGLHSDGVLRLGGVRRGRQLLLVEPEGREWAPSSFREFEMTESGAPHQEITVWRSVKKTVRVKRKDGTPVEKTEVDVVRPASDKPVDQWTHEVIVRDLGSLTNWGALRIAGGDTGADGTVDIAAPPHEPLVLRVLGPGHLPVIREVDFAVAGPIIDVVVTSGATFTGRILPAEILPQLQSGLADQPEERRPQGRLMGLDPGIRLRKPGSERIEFPTGFEAAALDSNGEFRLEAVPAGVWQVLLRYSESTGGGGGMTSSTTGEHVIGKIDLADGDERKETYDLSRLLKAELDGTVTVDGKPLDEGTITFEGKRERSDPDSQRLLRQNVKVSGGRFQVALWPSQYRALIQFAENGQRRFMHDVQLFPLAAGERVARSFDFRSSVLDLRVLASDGVTPVAGAEPLQIQVPDSEWDVWVTKTDAQGVTKVEDLPALTVTVTAWPKRLSSSESRGQAMRANIERLNDSRVQVATIAITPPLTTATIVLPASLGY